MSKERLVVIGGDAAGMSAASQARRRRPDLEIVAFERSPHTSYSACSIPYYVGGLIDQASRLVARTPQAFRERYDIDVRTLHEAVEVDLDRRRVRVHEVGGSRLWGGPIEQLLIATGAQPVVVLGTVPPLLSVTRQFTEASAERIRTEINPAIAAVAGELGAALVDNYAVFAERTELLAGNHPTQAGYEALAQSWFCALKEHLSCAS